MGELSWKEAIEAVLRERGEPTHYADITEEILSSGKKTTVGATPSYTVAANIAEDLKRGNDSKIVRVARGVYGLREWQLSPPAVSEVETEQVDPAPEEPSIRAFAMYWDREKVDWSRSNPKLLGQQFVHADAVDFSEQRGLYLLYDHRDIVYVGRATRQSLGTRLRDHTLDRLRTRWDRFSWFGFCSVTSDGRLRAMPTGASLLDAQISLLEAVLIETSEPPLNRQQGKGLTLVEYVQVDDPEIEKKRILRALAEKL